MTPDVTPDELARPQKTRGLTPDATPNLTPHPTSGSIYRPDEWGVSRFVGCGASAGESPPSGRNPLEAVSHRGRSLLRGPSSARARTPRRIARACEHGRCPSRSPRDARDTSSRFVTGGPSHGRLTRVRASASARLPLAWTARARSQRGNRVLTGPSVAPSLMPRRAWVAGGAVRSRSAGPLAGRSPGQPASRLPTREARRSPRGWVESLSSADVGRSAPFAGAPSRPRAPSETRSARRSGAPMHWSRFSHIGAHDEAKTPPTARDRNSDERDP